VLADVAEIHNRLDSKLDEIFESVIGRLGASVDVIIYSLEVREVLVPRAGPC
jgi:hypothetical protein